MTSKPVTIAAAATTTAAAVASNGKLPGVGAVAKLAPRDIDASMFIVNNCQAEGELDADEVFNKTVLAKDAKFALEKGLAVYEARYNDEPYDKNNPTVGKVERFDNTTCMTNMLPVPGSLVVDTQPKKMLKMEIKGYKKTPFAAHSLFNAVDRRSMRRVMLGHHILMGGLVTYPGYDAVYDEITDPRALVAAATENLKVDDVPKIASPKIDDVTLKTFPTLAVVYIERPDGSLEPRHAVPELVMVTVAGYITLLNARLEQTKESTHETKKAQYIKMIQRYITAVEEWLASDPKKHSTSTVLTLYNYSIVSDDKLNNSEAFNFVTGPKGKPFDEEKKTTNWHYILGHRNATNVVAEFVAKVRDLDYLDEKGQVVVALSDKEQLADESNRACTVVLKFAVPIVSHSYMQEWKNTDAGKQAISDGVEQGKKKRASTKKSPVAPSKAKKNGTTTAAAAAAANNDDVDGSGDESGDDVADESADEVDDGADGNDDDDNVEKTGGSAKAVVSKKSKPSPHAAAAATTKGKPSKAEIGEQGTADDTAKKIKAKNSAAAAAAVKSKASKEDGSRSADSEAADGDDDDDDNDADEAKVAVPKSKKAKKIDAATAEEDKQIAAHCRKMTKAKLEMEEVASHTATFKTPKSGGGGAAVVVRTSSKKSKRVAADDDDEDATAAAAAAAAPTTTTTDESLDAVKKVSKKAKKENEAPTVPVTTTTAESTATLADDKEIVFNSVLVPTEIPMRFFFRRRFVESLASAQTQIAIDSPPEEALMQDWLAFEAAAGNNSEAPFDAKLESAQDTLIAAAAWAGLPTLFIDLHDAIKKRQDAENAREAEAAAKLEAEQAAAAAAAAAAEEKRRKAEEAERKRKEKEEAEKKRKEEEAAAAAVAAAAAAAAEAATKSAAAATKSAAKVVAAASSSASATTKSKLPGETTVAWLARLKVIKANEESN